MLDLAQTRTELVVIQATPFCNVNCRYCYLPDRSSSPAHDLTPLERIRRLRERVKWEPAKEAPDDDDSSGDDWADWNKHNQALIKSASIH